jgi:hypothetical protein
MLKTLTFSALLFFPGVFSACRMRSSAPDVPLSVNLPDLDHFVREKPEILKRFLLSCPDWTARDMWNAGLMFSKQDETIEVRMPFGTGGGEEIWHPEYNFRFSKEAPIAHGVRAPVNVAAPTLGTLRVKLTQDKNTSIRRWAEIYAQLIEMFLRCRT